MKNLLIAGLALTAAPLYAETLNIYTSREPELIQPVLDQFTESTGVKTEIVYLKEGLIERLEAEGDRSPADLVITVDIANLSAIEETGVTALLSSEIIDSMPAEYRDEDAHWVGLTKRARIAYASNDRVAEGEISTYEDLADEKFEGRICSRSGLHNYNVALTSAMIVHHGEEYTKTWLEGVQNNLAKSPEGNDRAQAKAIWAGECDIALGNTYYLGLMENDPEQQEWVSSIYPIFLTFEDSGTHINLSGVSLLRSSKQPEIATQLIDYLLTDGQEMFAEINNEYPVNPDYQASALVQSWGELNADTTSLTEIAYERSNAIELIQEVDFDR